MPVAAPSHPPAASIRQLWQTFLENVNPLTKLVHAPTLQAAIEKASARTESIPRGFESLMFAIYSISILSMTDEETKETLGESRSALLPRYIAATKTALVRAKFMSSTSIVVLQALMLHILTIRDDSDPRAVWALTGAAIRVAEGMGMHIDGALLGLSPFESEIRRRVWWQIRMHDFRAAELTGQAKFRGFEVDETTPKMPANVNDSDLYPAMPHAPVESTRVTEMILIMLRGELTSFAGRQKARMRKLGVTDSASDEFTTMNDLRIKGDFINDIEDVIETKYLRYCDPSHPLQLMAMIMARISTNLLRFKVHHPRRWASLDQVPETDQKLVWGVAVQLLEQYKVMQSTPHLRGFAWNVPYSIHWHAVIHVMDTLRSHPLHIDAARAWRAIDALYENNSGILLTTSKPIFVAAGNLCLAAFDARFVSLANEQRSVRSDPPEYIVKLREMREAARLAKSRRETATARKRRQQALSNEKGLPVRATDASVVWPDTALISKQQVQIEALQQTNPSLGITRAEDDAFWFGAQGDGYIADGGADMMLLDTDSVLAQDLWLDSPKDNGVDWAQWDAWLSGNVDPIRLNVRGRPG
jgi:hypothetical protein